VTTATAGPAPAGWLLGPLQALVDDPAVTDVLVNGAHGVWVDRGAGLVRGSAELDRRVREGDRRLLHASD